MALPVSYSVSLLKQLTGSTADLGPIWVQIAIFGLQGERLPTGGLEPPLGMEVKTLTGLAPTEQKSVHNFC